MDLSVPPEQFRAQMRYLAENGYHTVTLDDLIYALTQGRALPSQPVVLTFDDGYIDAYQNAFPILREFGFVGTFFVVTGWIDDGNPAYISWDQAREMAQAGMHIEAHSKTHQDLVSKPNDFIVYEVLGSIESIEAHVGRRPRFFCYPAGSFDDALVSVLPDFGLWGAVTTQGGTRHYSDQLYTIRRARIRNGMDLARFAALLEWGREGDEHPT
jgi:peptidoglycan/xylan/chitin deacetylase (PgdA/CDA1 family)